MLYVHLCPYCRVRVKRMNGYVYYCPECGQYHDSDDILTVGQWDAAAGPGPRVASRGGCTSAIGREGAEGGPERP